MPNLIEMIDGSLIKMGSCLSCVSHAEWKQTWKSYYVRLLSLLDLAYEVMSVVTWTLSIGFWSRPYAPQTAFVPILILLDIHCGHVNIGLHQEPDDSIVRQTSTQETVNMLLHPSSSVRITIFKGKQREANFTLKKRKWNFNMTKPKNIG